MTNTNSNAKVTISQKFDMVIKALTEAEVTEVDGINLIEFIEDRKVKAVKKSTSKADEKKAEERKIIEVAITDILTERGRMRNSDLTKAVNEVLNAEYQPQKISNIVSALVKGGEVTRTEEKKVAYFSC